MASLNEKCVLIVFFKKIPQKLISANCLYKQWFKPSYLHTNYALPGISTSVCFSDLMRCPWARALWERVRMCGWAEPVPKRVSDQVPPLHSQHRALQGFLLCQVKEILLLWQYQRQEAPQSWRCCVYQGRGHEREVVANDRRAFTEQNGSNSETVGALLGLCT